MNQILLGDCLEVMRGLADQFFHACVTSPPYYGLRDYGVDGRLWPAVEYQPMPGLPVLPVPEWEGCLGQEPTPEMFVAHIVLIFREVHRVLRDDGTCWINFGDSYANDGKWGGSSGGKHVISLHGDSGIGRQKQKTGLKPKDLMGIPWRVAFALQADGWYLRQDVIYCKPNPMPESVRDRCTKAHEYIFLLSKSERYHYDHEAVKEPATPQHPSALSFERETKEDLIPGQSYKQHRLNRSIKVGETRKALRTDTESRHRSNIVGGQSMQAEPNGVRNKRSVWTVATRPCSDAHFAVYPVELIEPCILAGAPVDGHVLDPFGGAGTTGMACKRHRRNYTLIELKEEHCAIARKRIEAEPHPQLTIFDAPSI